LKSFEVPFGTLRVDARRAASRRVPEGLLVEYGGNLRSNFSPMDTDGHRCTQIDTDVFDVCIYGVLFIVAFAKIFLSVLATKLQVK
jgi:hypothetical protein